MSQSKILLTAGTLLGSLGFTRGVQHYTYQTTNRKEQYYYSSAFGFGLGGILMYLNPILIGPTVYKEIYRLEVNLREDLKEEKNTEYYNILF
jgi:hypothetical protein